MATREDLIAAFDSDRAYLLRLAYGTLGSIADAEDVVQEAGVRLLRLPRPDEIVDLHAWLTRVVGRLALDALRRARRTRVQYVGEWLPEPIVEDHGTDPADQMTLADSVSMALMVVLERLSPAERTAFVLHDVFGVSFDEIAEIVGRNPAAVRQLATRARRHVTEGRPRYTASAEAQRRVVEAFALACAEGDLAALLGTLEDEVIWRSDGGGQASAIRKPLRGRERVGKALLGFARRAPQRARFALVNGQEGLVITDADGVLTVMAFTLSGEKIVAIASIRNPRKLTHVSRS